MQRLPRLIYAPAPHSGFPTPLPAQQFPLRNLASSPPQTLTRSSPLQPDLDFAEVPALQRLPRLVYALLRSPLLASPPEGQHPDLTPFMRHLWASLPPSELQAAVYPSLSSWLGTDTVVRAALVRCLWSNLTSY